MEESIDVARASSQHLRVHGLLNVSCSLLSFKHSNRSILSRDAMQYASAVLVVEIISVRLPDECKQGYKNYQ